MNRSRQPTLGLIGLLAAFFVFASFPTFTSAQQRPRLPSVDATHFGDKVDLTGYWLVRAGDDLSWASPSVDDSGWTLISQSKDLSAQGIDHPLRAWYRKRILLRPDTRNASILIAGLSGNYALYVNGRLLRTHGSLEDGAFPVEGNAAPVPIPDDLIAASHGDLTIALRFYNLYGTHSDPLLPDTTVELVTPDYGTLIQSSDLAHHFGVTLGISQLYFIVGFCGLVLWIALRRQTEYLALAVWMLTDTCSAMLSLIQHSSVHSVASSWLILRSIAGPLSIIGQIEFVRIITVTRRTWWILAIEIAVFCAAPFSVLTNTGIFPPNIGVVILFAPYLVSAVILPVFLVRSALRGNLDSRLLLVPFALWGFRMYYGALSSFAWFLLHRDVPWPPSIHIGGYPISPDNLLDGIGLFALLLIILFRNIRLARERAALGAELAAAEQMQTLLLSSSSRPTPGYLIETEYLPAGEVGGDFFLISPAEDGSLLAIVGDVSGKGLQAAMRVALILGALNRETSRDPAEVLHNLNQALSSQGDIGFTTACCVHLQADGNFTFVNAGHLNPYIAGVECSSPGHLPLGLTAAAEFVSEPGHLAFGKRLILLSDGVAEARNSKGELFGFERTAAISAEPAKAIADAAKSFGQDDDITVVSIQCLATA